MKELSPVSSARLDALRFPLIVLVIYIHAKARTITFGDSKLSLDSGLLDMVKLVISDGVARTAVPMFFMLSGYLLLHSQKHWSWTRFGAKLRRRIDTLLVPYLFWNLSLFVILLVAQATALRVFFSGNGILAEMSWLQQVQWVLGFQRYPIAYQFWFIRDLMLLVLLTPAFFVLARRRIFAALATAILGFFWMTDWWPLAVPAIEAVLFFFIGLSAGIHGRDLFAGPPLVPVAIAYTALLTAFLLLHRTGLGSQVQHLLVATGIILSFAIVRNLPLRVLEPVAALAGASFFVFAVHEPLTTTFLKLSFRLLPVSSTMALAVYLLVPVLVVVITLALHRIATGLAPEMTRRITGR